MSEETTAQFEFTHGNYKTELSDHINRLYGGELDAELKGKKEERKQAVKNYELCRKTGDDYAASAFMDEIVDLDDVIEEIIAEKNAVVERLTEAYFAVSGEMPGWRELDRLSTWIQRYVEWDDDEAYVLTDRQLRTRSKEQEALFYHVEDNEWGIEQDGNRVIQPKPRMDSENVNEHKTWVEIPYDYERDKRKYNGKVEKYYVDKR